jgi:hypothetical protein
MSKAKTPAPAISSAIVAEAKKQMGNTDISVCEAIRNIGKKFPESRGDVIAVLTAAPYNVNKATVSTQFQKGRVA